jgi:hypothetical protein
MKNGKYLKQCITLRKNDMKYILSIIFVLLMSSVLMAQQAYVYTPVAPVYAYQYQPPPVTVLVKPRPDFYIRQPLGPFGFFGVWKPMYVQPVVPVVPVQSQQK